MRIGIFGGTFDPLHFGHLRAAEEAAEKLQLDRVLFIPAGDPPHRPLPGASARQRLAMVELAIADRPGFAVSTLEIERPGKSYTVDTLARLRELHPGDELFLLLGFDQIGDLARWREPARLFHLAQVVGIARPGVEPPDAAGVLDAAQVPAGERHRLQFLAVTVLDISSTDIRARLEQGSSTRYLVPEAVRSYIQQHGLYR